jgi:hypothetical protein
MQSERISAHFLTAVSVLTLRPADPRSSPSNAPKDGKSLVRHLGTIPDFVTPPRILMI